VRDLEQLGLRVERVPAVGAEEPGPGDAELGVAVGIQDVAAVAVVGAVGDQLLAIGGVVEVEVPARLLVGGERVVEGCGSDWADT
jgi:hypothetical protein